MSCMAVSIHNNNIYISPDAKSLCVLPRGGTQVMYVGVCLWAVHGATELRVFTVVAFCAAWSGGGVL